MPTITYRRLDENHDYLFGQGSQAMLTDTAAVAQAIRTRLLLFEEEWWLDPTDGLPLWQQILGTRNSSQLITLLIQRRIAGTPHVTKVTSIQATYDANSRQYNFQATVLTEFSTTITVTNVPVSLPAA